MSEAQPTQQGQEEEEEDYRESEDEDFNPDKKPEDSGSSSSSGEEEQDEYSKDDIETQGGLIKTRSQRKKLQEEEKNIKNQLQEKETASIDVDSLWASMNKGERNKTPEKNNDNNTPPPPPNQITIQHSYEFAGKTITQEKQVDPTSAQGKLWKDQQQQQTTTAKPPKGGLRKRKPSALQELSNQSKSRKVNTLEKSRLDWASFVDDQGINDELKHHNKGGYLDKQDFLARVDVRRHGQPPPPPPK